MMTSSSADFAAAARIAGCPADQVDHFARAGLGLSAHQLAASARARTCDQPDGPGWLVYDAAVDPPRSVWGFAQAVADDCSRVPGLRWLYLVRGDEGQSVRAAVADLRRRVLSRTVHQYDEVAGRIVLPNGSRVVCGGIRTEADLERYLGVEWDGAVVEGADQVDVERVRALMTCVRSSRADWRARTYLMATGGAESPLVTGEPGEQVNPWYALVRSLKETAGILLANGVTAEETRATLLGRVNAVLADVEEPLRSHRAALRAQLVAVIDQAIDPTVQPLGQEA